MGGGWIDVGRMISNDIEKKWNSWIKLKEGKENIKNEVINEILGDMEELGKILEDGMLDKEREGKEDEREGLGNVDIEKNGIGRGEEEGSRVGKKKDIGKEWLFKNLERKGSERKMNKRENELMNKRKEGRGEKKEREIKLDGFLKEMDDGLERENEERKENEDEIMKGWEDWKEIDGEEEVENGVINEGEDEIIIEEIDIFIIVEKFKWIERKFRRLKSSILEIVEEKEKEIIRIDENVMERRRNKEMVDLKIIVEKNLEGRWIIDK